MVEKCTICGKPNDTETHKPVKLGKNSLHLCEDCAKEFDNLLYTAFIWGYNASTHKDDVKKAFINWKNDFKV